MVPFDGLKRKPVMGEDGDSPKCPARPLTWPWSAIWSFLTQRAWEDGNERQTGTVLLFWEQGRLKACLSDRDAQAVGFVTLEGLSDPFDELENALRSDHIDWRAHRSANKRK